MSTPPFDPIRYKDTTREQWQNVAEAWHRWISVVSRWAGPMTDLMLDLARIGPGMRVLDIAAGDGDQSLMAARRVGTTGYVLATDIAPDLVAYAEQSAREAGLTNMEARVMDGEDLPLEDSTFDAVISRMGLMFFPNLQKALTEIRRVLKPGGRKSAIVFTSPDKSPFFSIPVSVIRRLAQLPAPVPGQPGPFSLGAPGVLEKAFREAGFRDVETHVVSAPLQMSSAAECLRWEQETFGALQQMLAGLDDAARQKVWEEIEQTLRQYESADGFESPGEVLVGVGVK